MLVEIVLILIAPYPFLENVKYIEDNSNWGVTISYEMN